MRGLTSKFQELMFDKMNWMNLKLRGSASLERTCHPDSGPVDGFYKVSTPLALPCPPCILVHDLKVLGFLPQARNMSSGKGDSVSF